MAQSSHYYTYIVVEIQSYTTILVLWVLRRKYGCTNHGCSQTFQSKNAWKRHENNHTQAEAWVCDESICTCGVQCCHLSYRQVQFLEHRRSIHDNLDKETERNRVGPRNNHQFWCGFCRLIVRSELSGMDAQNYRFDHIEEHIEKHRISIVRWGVTGNKYLWALMPGLTLYVALAINFVLVIAWILK